MAADAKADEKPQADDGKKDKGDKKKSAMDKFASFQKNMNNVDISIPGMPTGVNKSIFTQMQRGTVSVNTADNMHWNDVLIYTPDGSLVRYKGMDFFTDDPTTYVAKIRRGQMKYNLICGKKCCIKSATESLESSFLSWTSTDGVHKIEVQHDAGSAFKGEGRGPLADFFPCTPLCCSSICCKPCCKQGKVDFELLKPENFTVKYDGQVVATVCVQPGLKDGSTVKQPVPCRQTTAKDVNGTLLFEMNKVWIPKKEDVEPYYKCCAWPCPCCEVCKPCCCPICMPFGATCRCKAPRCNCGPCTFCCNKCCDISCKFCSCMLSCYPCIMCCQMFCFACNFGCRMCKLGCNVCCGCKCCKCGVVEDVESADSKRKIKLPTSDKHKAHRMVYPLGIGQGSLCTGGDGDLFGYATYTQTENSAMANRSSLAMNPAKYSPETVPDTILAALPLLIDLAVGSSGSERDVWTFASREYMNFFDPPQVVNYWPKAEVLQSVVHQFDYKDFINPTQGCTKPKQMSMDEPGENAQLLGKSG